MNIRPHIIRPPFYNLDLGYKLCVDPKYIKKTFNCKYGIFLWNYGRTLPVRIEGRKPSKILSMDSLSYLFFSLHLLIKMRFQILTANTYVTKVYVISIYFIIRVHRVPFIRSLVNRRGGAAERLLISCFLAPS